MFSVPISTVFQSYLERNLKTVIIQINAKVLNNVGTGDIIITLPEGYRPEHLIVCFGMIGKEACNLKILQNGMLYFTNKTISAGTEITINHTYFTS